MTWWIGRLVDGWEVYGFALLALWVSGLVGVGWWVIWWVLWVTTEAPHKALQKEILH